MDMTPGGDFLVSLLNVLLLALLTLQGSVNTGQSQPHSHVNPTRSTADFVVHLWTLNRCNGGVQNTT